MTVDKIITPPTKDEVVDKINEVIDNLGGQGTAPVWGNISGTLSNQTDLQDALDGKTNNTNIINGAPLSNTSSYFYGVSDSAATDVEKTVSIPSITELNVGQVIIVQPTITSTVANSTLKLNDFDAYPMRYNGVAITTSTDVQVWSSAFPTTWLFNGEYWVFVAHGMDFNTTTINNLYDAGSYIAGIGNYAVTRISLLLEKPNGTWEKTTDTTKNYTTATNKTANTRGFLLNHIRYYNSSAAVANGALIATNTLQNKASSVNLSYSTNCGTAPGWNIGDYIYLVGSMGADGLFYLDTTQWWSNVLPSTNDGKLYIRIGIALTTTNATASFFDDRPIFYHNGTKICEYKVADNKQDLIPDLATIRSGASAGATALQSITSSDVTTALGYNPVNPSSLSSVATSGDYDDLTNKPTIPSEVTESTVSNWGFTKNTGTVTSVNNVQPVNGNVTLTIPDTSNLANKDLSNLSNTGNSKFQVPLVSGTNIKTINNTSLLGSGNLTLDGLPSQTDNNGKFLTTDGTDASWGVVKTHNLLEFKWSDHLLDDISWLRADTFSWQSGDTYTSAYNHLVADLQGITSETETIGSYTVTFYRATDGHKICLADQEQTVLNIYNTYGIAWYYILDTTNTQFKLPRTKYGFEGLRTNVGDKIDESLPNITGMWSARGVEFEDDWISNGVFYQANAGRNSEYAGHSAHGDTKGVGFDASRSSSTYQDNAPVQERATQMYLYFYVGDYSQTAIEQTAGLNSELFNGKADISLNNVPTSKGILTESYVNGSSGYNLYSNGYCEQWGTAVKPSQSANTLAYATANLLIEMANNNYNVSWCATGDYGNNFELTQTNCKRTTTTVGIGFYSTVANNAMDIVWRVCGYKA